MRFQQRNDCNESSNQQHPLCVDIDTRFLVPTFNHVERLFSMSKRVFSTKRRSLLPRTLEALLFLKQNRSLWNSSLVSSIINKPRDTDHEVEEESESDENVYNKH
jgi:hypothetical protein